MNGDEKEKCVGEEASSLSGSHLRDIRSLISKLEKGLYPILKSSNEDKSEPKESRVSSSLIRELEIVKTRLNHLLRRIDL